ncbi:MAG: hypothetical protein ABFS42_11235 [Candidatus Krumholzibacteriota bacterium]
MISLMFNRFGPSVFFRLVAGPVLTVLVLGLMPGASPATAEQVATAATGQTELAQEIIDLIRREQRDEALPLCRNFNERFPGDQAMLYNQACLENMTGSPETAIATFAKAVAAGFDDFALAFSDPDLADLKDHPDMIELSRQHQIRLSRLASAKAETLSWQSISPPIPLTTGYSDIAPGDPEIRLTWTPVGLDIELLATGRWSDLGGPDNLAPWNGGSGLVLTLGTLDPDDEEFTTANFFMFAFGLESRTPVGAIYLAGQDRWQSLSELVPKIRQDAADNLELRTTIPWASILPYNPLVEGRLGFNAALRLADPGGRLSASLVPDPATFRPRSAERRIAPLHFQAASVAEDVFMGKVSNTISGTEPVDIDLVVVSREDGPGLLTIDFLGGPEQSLLPEGQASQSIELARGLNRLTRQADFSDLKTGAYVIKATLTFPSGRTQPWGSTVLQLAPGWREEFATRIEQLNGKERPTALFHLEAIEKAIAAHHPRRGPGAIVTTINELGGLLDNAESGGSIMPDKGSFLAVYSGPDGDTRVCHVYLPARWKTAARLNPVLMLTASSGLAGVLADRMGQNYEQGRQLPTLKAGSDEGFPIYLVPRLEPLVKRGPVDLTAEAASSLAWALDTFETSTLSLAGSDLGAAAALQLARERSAALKAMIIFSGGSLEPWPQANLDFIRQQLAGFPGDIPVSWADFINETRYAGQGPLILEALQDLGADIVEVEKVRGGLNFTQAADRTVLWAEGLR